MSYDWSEPPKKLIPWTCGSIPLDARYWVRWKGRKHPNNKGVITFIGDDGISFGGCNFISYEDLLEDYEFNIEGERDDDGNLVWKPCGKMVEA